jgi:hypothetical protein
MLCYSAYSRATNTSICSKPNIKLEILSVQVEIMRWKEKYAAVANDLLPRAQSEASLATEDLVIARNQVKAAQDAATKTQLKLEQLRQEFGQVLALFLCACMQVPMPNVWLARRWPHCTNIHGTIVSLVFVAVSQNTPLLWHKHARRFSLVSEAPRKVACSASKR